MPYVGANSNYTLSGVDIGTSWLTKEYLIDAHPNLSNMFKTSGMWLWGRNNYGQLGNNTRDTRSTPAQILAGSVNTWVKLASGRRVMSAIKSDGTLWSWGNNYNGQIGDNTTILRSSPVQIAGTNWRDVYMSSTGGFSGTQAIKTDGTLWTWGNVSSMPSGDGTMISRSSPVQILGGGTNWKQVGPGSQHVGAVKTDGTLWMWGQNNFGGLGINSSLAEIRSSPVQVAGTNWRQVACGLSTSAAIKTDGTLWLWGNNTSAQLGLNDLTDKSSPVQIFGGGTNWKDVKFAGFVGAATKTDGTLWTWGSAGGYGALGTNEGISRSSPTQTVSGGTNWLQLAGGKNYFAAIKTDGTLWLWGGNGNGQLGDNTIVNKSSPVQTTLGGTNWRLVTGGYEGAICIRDDTEDLI